MYNMVYKKMYLVSHHYRSAVQKAHRDINQHGQKKFYTWMSGFIQISSNFKNVKKKEKLPRNSIVTTGRSWGKFSPITLYGTSRRFKRDVTQFFQSRRISLRLVNNIFKSYVVYEPPITFKSTVFPMHHPSSMRT